MTLPGPKNGLGRKFKRLLYGCNNKEYPVVDWSEMSYQMNWDMRKCIE